MGAPSEAYRECSELFGALQKALPEKYEKLPVNSGRVESIVIRDNRHRETRCIMQRYSFTEVALRCYELHLSNGGCIKVYFDGDIEYLGAAREESLAEFFRFWRQFLIDYEEFLQRHGL